jgi:hypothetical protein
VNNYCESISRALAKGTTGIVAAFTADSPDFLAAVPDVFRDPVKLLAMAVSAAMLISLCFDIWKKYRHRND